MHLHHFQKKVVRKIPETHKGLDRLGQRRREA